MKAFIKSLWLVLLLAPLGACTLKVAAPEKPITINLNVKIEHEVRVKVEKDLENLFEAEDDLF
ncbi:YnbE family lipoprotein [Bacterioplanoides pacificum]|uniref:YnbE family lipoprotein n=1 Tax=Bacterioplanoides pacificum TaxID=1171596 RepID=A0ABV7VWI9_9GAMM